jgi:hypothetical protein
MEWIGMHGMDDIDRMDETYGLDCADGIDGTRDRISGIDWTWKGLAVLTEHGQGWRD